MTPDAPSAPDDALVEAKIAPLATKAAASAIWIGGAQGVKILSTFAATFIAARILSPNDYGVIAMVAPISMFVALFQDLGLSQSVVQAKVITDQRLNGLFWINMIASACIAALLVLCSPLASMFYNDPRVGGVVAASAIGIIVSGSFMQHAALMTRAMRFRELAVVDVASSLSVFAFTVLFAWLLRSYWAIWLGTLAGILAQAALLWRFDRWRPQLRLQLNDTREAVKFGSGLTGFNLMNFLVRNLDNVIVAKASGSVAVGLYDQSYKLMMAPMQAISSPLTRIVMPVLSRLQDEPERYRAAFLMSLRALSLALIPGLVVCALLSQDVVVLFLGERWAGAGPIFFWLSLAGLIQPIGNATGWLFLSSGRTTSMFYWGVLSAVVSVGGFLVGIQWGAVGVAAALFWTLLARLPILFPWCVRGTSVRALDLYAVLVEPTLGGLATAAFALTIAVKLPPLLAIALCLPAAYLFTLAAHFVTPAGRGFIRSLWDTGRRFIRERGARRGAAT